MWILFSPSEKKCLEHKKAQQAKNQPFYQNFICPIGLEEVLKAYVGILQGGKESEIQQMFGRKNLILEELAKAQNLMQSPLLPAVLRYIGVAFKALDFEHLESPAQDYLNQYLLIFSNLFGLLRAEDRIPYYDLKQGEGFKWGGVEFDTRKFYLKNTNAIWEYLIKHQKESPKFKGSLEILDLRAGFYQKCFDLSQVPAHFPLNDLLVYEPIFKRNGKAVSHYAKYYRGELLKGCAKGGLTDLADLENLYFEDLKLESIQKIQDNKIRRIVLIYAIKSKEKSV